VESKNIRGGEEMRLREVYNIVKRRIKKFFEGERSRHPLPIFIWGPPGIGKSSVVREVAKELGIGFIDLRLSLLESVDLRGLPRHENGKVMWSRPVFIPEEGRGILFLDELNTALPDVQNAALQLLLDRRIGEHKLGDGWFMIAAGNSREDGAHVYQLSSAVVGRMAHLKIGIEDVTSGEAVDEWCEWAMRNDIDERVISFIKNFPNMLLDMGPVKADPEAPYPSPRTWAELGWTQEYDYPEMYIGEAASVQFRSWFKVWDRLPDIDGILKGRDVPFPEDADVVIASVTALAKRCTEATLPNAIRWVLKGDEEFVVFFGRMVWKRFGGKVIRSTKEGNELKDRIKDVLFGGDE